MLKRCTAFLLTAMLAACVTVARPASDTAEPKAQPGDFIATNFLFSSGKTLPFLTLHYVTLGTPQRDSNGRCTNAVLLLHGITGAGKSLVTPTMRSELFAAGQPLDATRYYIIIPDALGRGSSSKPSDSLRAQFPNYNDNDIVDAQYRLVTEGLHIDHLNLVLGVSAGGMQTWLWGERYPNMMDGLMPIASQPMAIAGRNGLWRKMITEAIRTDPDWNGGNYLTEPTHWLNILPLFPLLVSDSTHLQSAAPTQASVDQLYSALIADARKQLDANDELYWFESSKNIDPEPHLTKIRAKLYALNFQGDLLNATDAQTMSQLVSRVPQGRFVEIPSDYGHQTVTHPEVWKSYLIEFLLSLPSSTS